ncbi:MAG: hypothetical protein BZ136_05150 [Methanosphaera sp. rholeuAM74]|nr:MAG: hypothetical protein BZ136_05150 [Methanosphaera sp. rholeuAM74]
MKTLIYPDIATNLTQYENLNSDIIVYDAEDTLTTQYEKTCDDDIFTNEVNIILAPTTTTTGKYDTKSLTQMCRQLSDKIRTDTLVVIDAQIPPRTVYKMKKVIDEYDLIPDIKIAYTNKISQNTRIIAATNQEALNETVELYKSMPEEIKTCKHIQTAEAIPLIKNTYKDTTIALSNQLAILSEALTIDLIEAIDIINNENMQIPYPKPILENRVIMDSNQILRLADEYGESTTLTQITRDTNNYVAYHMAYMAEKELYLKEHLAMFETTVAILGITEDQELITQEDNTSLILVDDFVSRDVEVWVHDDKISEQIIEEHGAQKITLEQAYEADCIIIMTDTPEYRELDPERIEKVIITALPLFDEEKFSNVKYSSVGQYRLKKGEML